MPKNAVQRLQKIDTDIKTVLSIYDNNSKEKDGESKTQTERALHFSKINPSKRWETSVFLEKLQDQRGQQPSLLLNSLKQMDTLIPRLDTRIHPREPGLAPKRHYVHKKPSSAPSSSSTLSTICESDHNWHQSSDAVTGTLEKPASLQTILSDSFNISELIDCNSVPGEYDQFMTPSRTIITANEILTKNNYPTGQKNADAQDPKRPRERSPGSPEKTKGEAEVPEAEGNAKVKANSIHRSSDKFSLLPAKTAEVQTGRNAHKDKSISDVPPVSTVPKKASKAEKQDSPEHKIRTTARSRTKDPPGAGWTFSKYEENRSGVKRERTSRGERPEQRSRSASERERTQAPTSLGGQRTRKSPETRGAELRVNELSKIIEKSNEKLEKMKVSKELALDIAKQLKDKYEEIQQSREGLVERLQNVEKDNERLNFEVKNVQESKAKLQLKVNGLKNSKTKLQEEEMKTRELQQANACLRAKITELERELSEKLIEKQNQIDQLQKERLSDIRNELKNRENRAEDVQRLNNEKSELAARVEHLRCTLKDREATVESQKQKIRLLEGELQKQKQHLKKKTDRLEETNKELESIRKNSNDLEEQVKALRKSMESFEDMHKNLIKQTADYEHQVRLKQDENQFLKDDNSRLKTELENEKDALLIKTKIIEDQQETMRQLREKAEEAKTLLKRNQSLERVLSAERDEKLELQEAVERLKWRKDELKSRIKTLESDLLLAPQEVVRDLQKTQMVLHELENQVQMKQKEWELHLQALIREKEQACSVAEFATKKLMQTTTEFQKQSEAHKRLHRVLAENLAEKERHLREVNEKLIKTEK